jgi:hypothetical protein
MSQVVNSEVEAAGLGALQTNDMEVKWSQDMTHSCLPSKAQGYISSALTIGLYTRAIVNLVHAIVRRTSHDNAISNASKCIKTK